MGKKDKKELQIKTRGHFFDVTVPGEKPVFGHLHPLTIIQRKAQDIFKSLGFSIIEGPEVETEWYNFDALNIPRNHPARDMWDTFWLKSKASKKEGKGMLLRTHTSPLQVRFMEKNRPPFRIIAPGRVFRHEATDATHEINFYQLEGLMVDKYISVANFRAIIEEFFKAFFNKSISIRLRPSYFPFVEPGFEIDLTCINCLGYGCSSCKKSGWLEIMGAGIVNSVVFKNVGVDSKTWQGFAFGMGLDRLAIMKYRVDDIRLFYSGDLRFLYQF